MYKIVYHLSLLPQCGTHIIPDEKGNKTYYNQDISIMDLVTHTDEFDIFLSRAVQDYINFKWNTFGRNWHLIGCTAHFIYIAILIYYNSSVYIYNVIGYKSDPERPEGGGEFNRDVVVTYAILLGIGICYAFLYDMT